MIINILHHDKRIHLPVPTALAGSAIKMIPDIVFEKVRNKFPAVYRPFITRNTLLVLYKAFKPVLLEYKGLEVVHIDGPKVYVSITL